MFHPSFCPISKYVLPQGKQAQSAVMAENSFSFPLILYKGEKNGVITPVDLFPANFKS